MKKTRPSSRSAFIAATVFGIALIAESGVLLFGSQVPRSVSSEEVIATSRHEILPEGADFQTYLTVQYSDDPKGCTTLYALSIKEGSDGTGSISEKIDNAAVRAGKVDVVFTSAGQGAYLTQWRNGLANAMPSGHLLAYCMHEQGIYFLLDEVAGSYTQVLWNENLFIDDGLGAFHKSQPVLSGESVKLYPNAFNGRPLLYTSNYCYSDACPWDWSYYEIGLNATSRLLEYCSGYYSEDETDGLKVDWNCPLEYHP